MRIKSFKEYLLEDVGDKYAEKRFNIPQKFTEFDKQYRRRYNNIGQEVVYKDKEKDLIILKNPGTLDSIGPGARGIIDIKGNFFIEQESTITHNPIINILWGLGILKSPDEAWHMKPPNNFITVQRRGDDVKLGESNSWYDSHKPKSIKIFQEFLDKAKKKNPGITFTNKLVFSPWQK